MIDKLIQFRTDLHQIPELAFEEFKTKAYLLDKVASLKNVQVHEVLETGLLLYFGGEHARTIAFRADMDALPIEEKTAHSFASTHPGKMHACGHDGHMSILLGLAYWLDENYHKLGKDVALLFQPSEEKNAGANYVIETGILQQFNIEAIFGLHVWPGLEGGKIYSRAGELMAGGSEITITVNGKATHVADAHLGIDALHIASQLLCQLYDFEAGLPDDMYRLLRFGQGSAGFAMNVIADKAVLNGTVRSFYPEDQAFLKANIEKIASELGKQTGATIDVDYVDGYDPVVNNPALFEKTRTFLTNLQVLERPVMQAEDFGCYAKVAPIQFFFLGLGDVPPLHNEKFDFDMAYLEAGLELFIEIVEYY